MLKKEIESDRDQADATVDESISAASSLMKKVHGKVRTFEETKTLHTSQDIASFRLMKNTKGM